MYGRACGCECVDKLVNSSDSTACTPHYVPPSGPDTSRQLPHTILDAEYLPFLKVIKARVCVCVCVCVPSMQWMIVQPINHILGRAVRASLLRLCPRASAEPTSRTLLCGKFRVFRARAGRPGGPRQCWDGGILFELNLHSWQFGRPQPRTNVCQRALGARGFVALCVGKHTAVRDAGASAGRARERYS